MRHREKVAECFPQACFPIGRQRELHRGQNSHCHPVSQGLWPGSLPYHRVGWGTLTSSAGGSQMFGPQEAATPKRATGWGPRDFHVRILALPSAPPTTSILSCSPGQRAACSPLLLWSLHLSPFPSRETGLALTAAPLPPRHSQVRLSSQDNHHCPPVREAGGQSVLLLQPS